MPQNKLWDFWSKSSVAQDIETPADKPSPDTTSPGSNDVEASPSTALEVKASSSDKDESTLITYGESSEEWTRGKKGTIYSGLYFLFGSFVLIFFMNFTNQRMPRGVDPLPDVGHDLIPKMRPEILGDITQVILIATFWVCMVWLRGDKKIPYLSKFLDIVVMIAGYIPGLKILAKHIPRNGNRWPIITKFFLTLGNLYLIRSLSVYVTSVPATDNHCRYGYQDIPNIWINTIKGIISLGSSNIHCGDLMFSGHTCMVTNIWLSLNANYKKDYVLRIATTILWLLTFIFIIGTRSHYTIDIWIALWLTIFIHAYTPTYFPFTKKNMRRFVNNWVYGKAN